MFFIKLLFLKVLKKTKWIDKFNFFLTKEFNGKKIKTPFINGTGLTNFVLEKDWLDLLIQAVVKEESGCFVDVGMNIGQTLLRVKSVLPDIEYIGFEPNSTCTSYCQQLVSINHFKNCTIQNCALSFKVQNLTLEKTLVTDVRASVVPSFRPGFFCEYENVLAIDYQSFYLDKKIAFVKIDVEGGEFEVLAGMRNAIEKYQPIIACEILDSHSSDAFDLTQTRAKDVAKLVKSLNYSIIRLNTNNSKINSYEQIDTIIIKQWTLASYASNDYIFYPKGRESYILDNLNKMILT